MTMDAKIEFADILASTLHDTKNSLGMLFNTMERLIGQCQEQSCGMYQEFYMLQYEIKRLNHSLIRLLTLYKAEKAQLSIDIDYHSVYEFLEDIILQNQPILNSRGIDIELECPDTLFKAFDRTLVTGVLDNVLNNTFRYTKDKLRVFAWESNGYLALSIEDNGPGYPESMIVQDSRVADPTKKTVDFESGSTGLGLYFSMLIAHSHRNNDQEGYISMVNGGTFGGGVFTIFLP